MAPVTWDPAHPFLGPDAPGQQPFSNRVSPTNPILMPWAWEELRKLNDDGPRGQGTMKRSRPASVPGAMLLRRKSHVHRTDAHGGRVSVSERSPSASHLHGRAAFGAGSAVVGAGHTQAVGEVALQRTTMGSDVRTRSQHPLPDPLSRIDPPSRGG